MIMHTALGWMSHPREASLIMWQGCTLTPPSQWLHFATVVWGIKYYQRLIQTPIHGDSTTVNGCQPWLSLSSKVSTQHVLCALHQIYCWGLLRAMPAACLIHYTHPCRAGPFWHCVSPCRACLSAFSPQHLLVRLALWGFGLCCCCFGGIGAGVGLLQNRLGSI
jgi:hypothetical protein